MTESPSSGPSASTALVNFRKRLDAARENRSYVQCFEFARHWLHSSQRFKRRPANATSVADQNAAIKLNQRAAWAIHQLASGVLFAASAGICSRAKSASIRNAVERIQHQKRNPKIGNFLNELPARGEERDEIDAEKQKQPRAHADDERLRAIVCEKSRGQSERKKRGREQQSLHIEQRDSLSHRSRPQMPGRKSSSRTAPKIDR